MGKPKLTRGLPNVVQSESRIVSLVTPITASGRTFIMLPISQTTLWLLYSASEYLVGVRGLEPPMVQMGRHPKAR